MTTAQEIVAARLSLERSQATRKGHDTRRTIKAAKTRAETDSVHRAAYVGSAVAAFGNFIHDHAPATEFSGGNSDTRFTTDAVCTMADGDAALTDALLQAGETPGIIRSDGEGRWAVLTEDGVYGNEFGLAVRRLSK
jgi:hypothetical protein